MTNTNQLPEAATRYLEAANRFDAAGAAACFTPDAVVSDEQEDHVGTAAIERWIAHTSRKYQPKVTVTEVKTAGRSLLIGAAVAGNFPGSPVQLDYEMHFRDGRIARMNIR